MNQIFPFLFLGVVLVGTLPVKSDPSSWHHTFASFLGSSLAQTPSNCDAYKNSVFTVRAGREIGSGSLVKEDLILTNFHVIRHLQGQALKVESLNGISFSANILKTDRDKDMALLQVSGLPSSLPPIPISLDPQLGKNVCAIGSPLGKPGVLTKGKLANFLPNGDIESTVFLRPGNSGGPLLNQEGQMIGINKGVSRSNEGVSFATSSKDISNFINESGSQ